MTGRDTGRPPGFAFAEIAGANQAIAGLNGAQAGAGRSDTGGLTYRTGKQW